MFPFTKKRVNNNQPVDNRKRRILSVQIVEARNLLAVAKLGGKTTSCPYVSLSLLDLGSRPVKNEGARTEVQKETMEPVWDQTFTLGQVYDLDTVQEDLPSISMTLFHKAVYGVSDTPLGEVKIYLSTVDPDGGITDMWYPVEKFGRMTESTGEVHVRLKFSSPAGTSDDEIRQTFQADGMHDYSQLDGDVGIDTNPNELIIHAIQGRGLQIMDRNLFRSGGSSDPLIKFKISGFKSQESSYIKGNLNPNWNQRFVWSAITDGQLSITAIVQDYNDIQMKKFMGKVTLPLGNFDDRKLSRKWYKLKSDKNDNDGIDRGEVELAIIWRYNSEVAEEMKRKNAIKYNSIGTTLYRATKNITNTIGLTEADDEIDELDGEEPPEIQPDEDTEEEKKGKEDARLKFQTELSEIDIKSGDYQIQVHIIEARDLNPENFDGTSDPIVYIEAFGQKQNTVVKYGCTMCVYDELFIFNFKNLDKEAFEEGIIRISCYDANAFGVFGKKTMIGAYVFDATQVYSANKDHELYRKWVPLMDDEDAGDNGVQGYLKISVQIIGPGEKIKVHNEEEDIMKERAVEDAASGDIGSLCLSTPVIVKAWKYVVVSVYRAEGLPVMDGKIGIGKLSASAKTDAFCSLQFAGGKNIKTKVRTVYGDTRDAINPIFNCELWYPVSIPTMTQLIKFGVYDSDPEKNEVIGNVVERLSKVQKEQENEQLGMGQTVRWYNLYGAPEFKTDNLKQNIIKGSKQLGNLAKQLVVTETDYFSHYNNIPEHASSYKGRVLLRFQVKSQRPPGPKYETSDIKPFRRAIKGITKVQEPAVDDFVLHAVVISGSELPSFTPNVLSTITAVSLKKQDLRVMICIGTHEVTTSFAKYEKGVCRWNQYIKSEVIKLPSDLSQLPDIFIYLIRQDDNKAVCFTRLKAYNAKSNDVIGFDGACQWYLLREDKVTNALNDGDFPGSVLIKLGFGRAKDMDHNANTYKETLQKAVSFVPYHLRVHIFQGKNLPPADADGLCDPYIRVSFMGVEKQSTKKKSTLYPIFYESILFDEPFNISEHDDFLYASMVNFKLFDSKNIPGASSLLDKYLGNFSYSLTDAHKTLDPLAELPDPKWYNFFKEVPNDGQGQLLVLVQLIPMQMGEQQNLKLVNSIKPEVRDAFIELIAVGIRDMSPYNFLPMQAPFLEIEMNSIGALYKASTGSSKKPNPSNPNFLERIVMPCQLPMKSIYAQPIQIRARDTRLGGYSKPTVGVGIIDITTKIPWCEDTYRPPQSQTMFEKEVQMLEINDASGPSEETNEIVDDASEDSNNNKDVIAMKARSYQNTRDKQFKNDDFIASLPPVQIDEFLQQRKNDADSGAGVFGALHHIKLPGEKKKTLEELCFVDPDWAEDDSELPPAWSIGRKVLDAELEKQLDTTPFETYLLTRGSTVSIMGNNLKVVGKFKGLVRVMYTDNDPDLCFKDLMDDILKPKKYKVRLYLIRATNLTAMDKDIFNNVAKSDPYVKINFGKFVYDDRKNAITDVTDVDLYKVIEFDAELPGTSQVNIKIMDKDDFGSMSDDLIGSTTIDLEDRWFDSRWQDLGKENMVQPSNDGKGKFRWQTKPIERRSLYVPKSQNAQGVLECWIDIMKPESALAFPPDDVSLPPKQMFEVRVVIWKSKDVPAMDSLEGMSDLFVKCWPEGCDVQETDTHWRCKKGKASWNWRLIFDVELGHNTRAMKFPYLHFQLWDRDILKWNDCAGEGQIDLYKYYKKAYKRNVSLKLFEKKKGAAAARAKRQGAATAKEKFVDTDKDIPPEEELNADDAVNHDAAINNPILAQPAQSTSTNHYVDSDDDDDDDYTPITVNEINNKSLKSSTASTTIAAQPPQALKSPMQPMNVVKPTSAAVEKKGFFNFWPFVSKNSDSAAAADDDETDQLLVDGEANEQTEEERRQEDLDDTLELVSTFKAMTGLWDEDPPDSAWYKLEKSDHNGGKPIPMGSLCYSVQIWPKDKAMMMPVGSGRNEPNTNPYLPPPVGRFKWSWNPFVLGSELCGPKLCAQLFCCLLCIAFIVLMIFCQPFLNIIINLIFIA